MLPIDLTKVYISQAIYAVGHRPDQRVRYKQEDAERAFRSVFGSQSQQTNVPDELDASAPRLVFQGAHKQLLLSQTAAQLVLGFESADRDLLQQVDIVAKNIRDIHSRIEKYKERSELTEGAIVLTINFPSKQSREEMIAYIYDRFLKVERLASVASASFKVGYLTPGELFLNLEVDVYQLRRAEFTQPAIHAGSINIMDLPVIEEGYSFKLDINNKPQAGKNGYVNPGPDAILGAVTDFVSTKLFQMMGLGN